MKKVWIELDTKSCKRCGICVELCPKKVFTADDMGLPIIIDSGACTQCLFCELHCPEYAIGINSEDTGEQ